MEQKRLRITDLEGRKISLGSQGYLKKRFLESRAKKFENPWLSVAFKIKIQNGFQKFFTRGSGSLAKSHQLKLQRDFFYPFLLSNIFQQRYQSFISITLLDSLWFNCPSFQLRWSLLKTFCNRIYFPGVFFTNILCRYFCRYFMSLRMSLSKAVALCYLSSYSI